MTRGLDQNAMAFSRLAVILIIAVLTPVLADSETLVQMRVYSYWGKTVYTIDFSRGAFDSLHSCLCDVDNDKCCTEVEWENRTTYKVKQSEQCGFPYEGLRHNIYICALYLQNSTTEITCSRFKDDTDSNLLAEYSRDPPFQSFYLGKPQHGCGHQCINVRWDRRQKVNNITLSDKSVPLYSDSCFASKPSPASSTTSLINILPAITASEPNRSRSSSSSQMTKSATITSTPSWKTTQTTSPLIQTTKSKSKIDVTKTDPDVDLVDKDPGSDDQGKGSTSTVGLGVSLVIAFGIIIIVVAVIVIISVTVWSRRKNQTKPPTMSHGTDTTTVTFTHDDGRSIDRNSDDHERNNTGEASPCDNDNDNDNTETRLLGNDAQAKTYVSPAEVIRKKRASAARRVVSGTDQGTDQSDPTTCPLLDPTAPASNVYSTNSRSGNQVRVFENPYNDRTSMKDNFTKESRKNDVSRTQDSPVNSSCAASLSNQSSAHFNVSRLPSQSFTSRAYEDVDVVNTAIKTKDVSSGNGMATPRHLKGSDTTVTRAPTFPEDTEDINSSSRDTEPALHVYARLGEPVRNIENPYDG